MRRQIRFRAEEAAAAAAREARQREDEQRARLQSHLVTQLQEVGVAWFDEMQQNSELMNAGPKGIVRSAMVKAGMTEDGAPDILRTSVHSVVYPVERSAVTFLDLLDSRYMAPGGQLHGRHIEALNRQLEQKMSDRFDTLQEQMLVMQSFLTQLVQGKFPQGPVKSNAVSPCFSITAASHQTAAADSDHLKMNSPSAMPSAAGTMRSLPSRPGSAHVRMLQASRSAASVLGYQ